MTKTTTINKTIRADIAHKLTVQAVKSAALQIKSTVHNT